jgi:glyoxylase-like metal-dependent hydrolase (beta-lactamase superfamily II)
MQVADGVLVSESAFCRSNAVVVQGRDGVLLIDAGIRGDEMVALAHDLRELGEPVVAGFSTHPHWDHLLWHADLGSPPRYGTARCAGSAAALLSTEGWQDRVAGVMPPDLVDQVPLDLFGLITGLPAEATHLPWDGPRVRILEHQAHAQGHAALVLEESGVLVSGDMLSDLLVPMLDLRAADPMEAYLGALRLLESVTGDVGVVVPGHGSVGAAGHLQGRIDQDLAYVEALREGREIHDPRIGPAVEDGWGWVTGVHDRQRQQLAERGEREGTPG